MGTTVTSQRIISDSIISELKDYGSALRKKDREEYEKLLKSAYLHFASISNASSMHAWALILLSIILEQQKCISFLEGEVLGKNK